MAALDLEATRFSGFVVFRRGRCREGLAGHYRAEEATGRPKTSLESAIGRG
jgi:hypothetical protein